VVDKVQLGQVFLRVLQYSYQCHSINASYSFIRVSQTYNLSNWQCRSIMHILALRSTFLLDKITGPQQTEQFLACYGTGRFITMFTWPCHWSPFRDR
jgi:hypothetical protein